MARGLIRYDTRLTIILSLTFGVVFFDRNAVGFLMPWIKPDLHLNNAEVGLAASALSLTWALSGLFVGWLSDATGRRKPILICAIVAFSVCSFVSGLAQSFLVLLGARLLMGAAEGPILPISQSIIAIEADEKQRGFAMGVLQNFGSNFLGSFVAPLVLGGLAAWIGWRHSFFLAGAPGLIAALVVAFYMREPPRVTHTQPTPREELAGFVALLGYRNIILCMAISLFSVSYLVLGWSFLPLYFTEVRHFTPVNANILMSVLGVSATVGAFVVPGLSDRLGRKPIVVAFSLIGLVLPAAVLWYGGSVWVLAVLLFAGWGINSTFPLFMATIPSETVPPRYIATALGLTMGFGEVVGGFMSQPLAGWAADIWGLGAPVVAQAGCALVSTALALFLIETAPSHAALPAAAGTSLEKV